MKKLLTEWAAPIIMGCVLAAAIYGLFYGAIYWLHTHFMR
jgi:high-affinity Fe2+/Pb2+ permease